MVREVEDGKSKWGTRLKEYWKEFGVKSIEDVATRSRIEAGWHPNWERARRRRTKVRDNAVMEFSSPSRVMQTLSCGARVC